MDQSTIEIAGNEPVRTARITFRGDITPQSFRWTLNELTSHPEFVRSMNSVIDVREGRFVFRGPHTLGQIADVYMAFQIQRGHGFRIAFLVDSDLDYGLCRMLMVELEQVPIYARVVRSEEEALMWVHDFAGAVSHPETA